MGICCPDLFPDIERNADQTKEDIKGTLSGMLHLLHSLISIRWKTQRSIFLHFLPRDATQSKSLICLSVYLSIRLSVTFRYAETILRLIGLRFWLGRADANIGDLAPIFLNTKVVLSQWKPRDAAENLDMRIYIYSSIARFSLRQHGFLVF